jgi:hypothetical protein
MSEHIEASASEWRSAYLQHWTGVREVWLGGGLVAALGMPLVEAAKPAVPGVRVEMAPNPNVLALLGLARTLPYEAASRVVLDFGHSRLKRGVAMYSSGELTRLHLLDGKPIPRDKDMVDFVTDTIARTVEAARWQYGVVQQPVRVSIASYVHDGHPFDTRSIYARLTSEAFAHEVRLEHDGTAAARGVQPTVAPAAVILLGTSLGVGFAPSADRVIPFGGGFSVPE